MSDLVEPSVAGFAPRGVADQLEAVEVITGEGGFWALAPLRRPVFVPITPAEQLPDHLKAELREWGAR